MRINWIANDYNAYSGYGRWSLHTLRALNRTPVDARPLAHDVLKWPTWLAQQAGADWSRLTIGCMSVEWLKPLPGRYVVSTMWETTRTPAYWTERIERAAAALIVPHAFLVDVFRQSGVSERIPIYVVPGGIDPDECPVRPPRLRDRPFTFLALADRGNRKGHDLAYRAFYAAFGNRKDVRMVWKCRAEGLADFDLSASDPRFSIWRGDVERIADVYEAVDCMVFPSRGEGWGLPPREAAATGLPVIATNWSGLTDGIDHWALPIGYRLKKSIMPGGGDWADPDFDDLVDRMRWVVDCPDDAMQHGQRAATWLREHQTWTHSANALADVLERIA